MKTKLHPRIGFHTASSGGNPRGIGDKYVKRLHAAGIPVAITCADGDVGIADALANPHSGDVLIFRVVRDGSERFAVPDYNVTPTEAAAKYWDLISPLIHKTVTEHKDKIWLAYGNELNRGNAQWVFKWSLAMVKLLNSQGYKGVGPNWAAGCPGEDNKPPDEAWRTPESLDFLRYCAENPEKAAVGIHEYSYNENDLFDGDGTKVGRYRHIVKVCQENQIARPTILIKEFGYGATRVPSASQIVGDLRRLYQDYPDYPPATFWYLGSGYGNIADLLQPAIGDIAEFIAGLEVEVDLAEPIVTKDPKPVEPKPVDVVRVVKDDKPESHEAERHFYNPPARVTVSAQPHLNLRREPMVSPDNVVGQLSDGSTWPVVGVAREGFNADAGVLWVQLQVTDSDSGQTGTSFCRSDFVSPQPDPLPATQRVLPDDGLNLRSSPVFDKAVDNKIVTMKPGAILRVLGGAWENFDPQIGKWWYVVEYEGQRGYAYSRFLEDVAGGVPVVDSKPVVDKKPVTPGEGSVPSVPVRRPSPAWKPGVCLAGAGNTDANVWHEPSFPEAIKAARLEAVKIVPLNDGAKMNKVYNWFRSQGIAFVMVRLTWKPDPAWANLPASQRTSAAVRSFVAAARGQLEFAYDNGVRYFEVHNEPNITPNPTDPIGDGLGSAWLGPGDFAEWFSRVSDELRQMRGDIFLGFPGLAPRGTDHADFGSGEIVVQGQKLLWNTDKWLSICKSVIDDKADWIGVHCYWQFDGGGQFGIENADSGGMYWRRYQAKFPGKLLFITEFSNNGGQTPHAEKGRQYAKYIAMLRREKAIGAAFGYAIYWATDPNNEGWVSVNEQGKFRVGEIPGAMGAAMAANPTTAKAVVVNAPDKWV